MLVLGYYVSAGLLPTSRGYLGEEEDEARIKLCNILN